MKHTISMHVFICFLFFCTLSCSGKDVAVQEPPVAETNRTNASPDAQAIYSYLSYREYLHEQKITEAVHALETAISLAPTPELYLELGNLYWRTSKFAEAAFTIKQGLEQYPSSVILLTTLAKTYAAQGRFDDAVLTLDDYLRLHPESIEIIHEAAAYRLEQRNFGDAADRLTAVPARLATPTTTFLLGKAYVGLGLHEKAISCFQTVVQADEEHYDAWIELGLTYEAMKNNVEANRVFSRIFDAGLENQQIIFRLVDLNLKLNNPDKALSYVLEHSDDIGLTLESANLFLNQGFYDHAAQLLDPLASQAPTPPNALFYLAILEYEGRDNPVAALQYLEQIPNDHPHHERSLIFRIHLLFQSGATNKAKELCLSAKSIYPNQPEFHIILAEILERDNALADSLDTLLNAANRWPQSTTILYRLGLLYDRMNHQNQTLVMMEKIIEIDPEHADALNYLGYTLAESNKDLDRAEILIKNALQVKPDNGYFIDSLAWVYFKQGKLQRAWKEIKRAVQFVSTDPVIWEHYGDIAKSINLLEEALKGYRKALENKTDNESLILQKIKKLDKTQ